MRTRNGSESPDAANDGARQAPVTVTEICRRCGVERHHVTYLIRARGLKPAARVGAVRVFSPQQARFIAAELQRCDRTAPRSGNA